MEERRPALGKDPLRLLFWDVLMCLVRLLGYLAERAPQQQASSDAAGAEPARIGAPAGSDMVAGDAGADRQGAAGGSVPQGRVAANAADAATVATPVIAAATPDDCITDAVAVRAASEPPHLAAIAPPSLFCGTAPGFWWLGSKKSVRDDTRTCADFVTI